MVEAELQVAEPTGSRVGPVLVPLTQMASPHLLQFCCPQGSPATDLVRHFYPEVWNGLCLGSAGLGLAGLLLLEALAQSRGWGWGWGWGRLGGRGSESKLCPTRGIAASITVSSWLGTAGILGRSVLWLAAPPSSESKPPDNQTAVFAGPLCIVVVTWVQYFYTVNFWALVCYALEAVQLLRGPDTCRSVVPYYLLSWGASSTQCLWGIQQLLSPARARCDSWHPLVQALAVSHYMAAYVPFSLVLLVNPLLLSRALCTAAALLRRRTGMYTAWERLQEEQLRRRFTSITVTITACWLANVVNDGLLLLVQLEPVWHMETPRLVRMAILTSWISLALLNPVSGFLLSLAFLGWQGAWQLTGTTPTRENSSKDSDEWTSPEPVVGLRAVPGQLWALTLHCTLDSRASLEFSYLVSEPGAAPQPSRAKDNVPLVGYLDDWHE